MRKYLLGGLGTYGIIAVKPQTASYLVEEAKREQALKDEKSKTSVLIKRIMELEKREAAFLALKSAKAFYKIAKSCSTGGEAVAVMVASDWHIEEVITDEQKVEVCNKEINEVLNKYGLTIQVVHLPQLVEVPKA